MIECKWHKRRVERGDVQELLVKLHSTGAHKGVMVSVVGFQRGALEFAKKHGIACLQVADKIDFVLEYMTLSAPRVRSVSREREATRRVELVYLLSNGRESTVAVDARPDLLLRELGLTA